MFLFITILIFFYPMKGTLDTIKASTYLQGKMYWLTIYIQYNVDTSNSLSGHEGSMPSMYSPQPTQTSKVWHKVNF